MTHYGTAPTCIDEYSKSLSLYEKASGGKTNTDKSNIIIYTNKKRNQLKLNHHFNELPYNSPIQYIGPLLEEIYTLTLSGAPLSPK
jgi:hypothetical protein